MTSFPLRLKTFFSTISIISFVLLGLAVDAQWGGGGPLGGFGPQYGNGVWGMNNNNWGGGGGGGPREIIVEDFSRSGRPREEIIFENGGRRKREGPTRESRRQFGGGSRPG